MEEKKHILSQELRQYVWSTNNFILTNEDDD